MMARARDAEAPRVLKYETHRRPGRRVFRTGTGRPRMRGFGFCPAPRGHEIPASGCPRPSHRSSRRPRPEREMGAIMMQVEARGISSRISEEPPSHPPPQGGRCRSAVEARCRPYRIGHPPPCGGGLGRGEPQSRCALAPPWPSRTGAICRAADTAPLAISGAQPAPSPGTAFPPRGGEGAA